MTDDLVKRLRSGESGLEHVAADRIEELEKIAGLTSLVQELADENTAAHIEELRAALKDVIQYVSEANLHNLKHETWGVLGDDNDDT